MLLTLQEAFVIHKSKKVTPKQRHCNQIYIISATVFTSKTEEKRAMLYTSQYVSSVLNQKGAIVLGVLIY